MKMKDILSHAASASNPPKGYGLNKGLEVIAYRNHRITHHSKGGDITSEVLAEANKDVISKFGEPR